MYKEPSRIDKRTIPTRTYIPLERWPSRSLEIMYLAHCHQCLTSSGQFAASTPVTEMAAMIVLKLDQRERIDHEVD